MRLPQMPFALSLVRCGQHLPQQITPVLHTFMYCMCHLGRMLERRSESRRRTTAPEAKLGGHLASTWYASVMLGRGVSAGFGHIISWQVRGLAWKEFLENTWTLHRITALITSKSKFSHLPLPTQLAPTYHSKSLLHSTAAHHADVSTRSLGSGRRQPCILPFCLQRVPIDSRLHASHYGSLSYCAFRP